MHALVGALHDLVRSGKVRVIGCSNLSAAELQDADDAASELGLEMFASLQTALRMAISSSPKVKCSTVSRLRAACSGSMCTPSSRMESSSSTARSGRPAASAVAAVGFAILAFRVRRDYFHEELVWKSGKGLLVLAGCALAGVVVYAVLAFALRQLAARAPGPGRAGGAHRRDALGAQDPRVCRRASAADERLARRQRVPNEIGVRPAPGTAGAPWPRPR